MRVQPIDGTLRCFVLRIKLRLQVIVCKSIRDFSGKPRIRRLEPHFQDVRPAIVENIQGTHDPADHRIIVFPLLVRHPILGRQRPCRMGAIAGWRT